MLVGVSSIGDCNKFPGVAVRVAGQKEFLRAIRKETGISSILSKGKASKTRPDLFAWSILGGAEWGSSDVRRLFSF